MKKNLLTAAAFCLSLSILASCSSVPKVIPTDASIEELKQRAYELTSQERYADAEKYYQTIIERYGMNAQVLISAEYEIAHLYVKQKKYDEAEPRLTKIVNYYEVSNSPLPQQFRKLAELDLEKIQDARDMKDPQIRKQIREDERARRKAQKALKSK